MDKKKNPNFDKTLLLQLRRAFGPRFMPFFEMYTNLYIMGTGVTPVPENLLQEMRGTFRRLSRMIESEIARDAILDSIQQMGPSLKRLQQGQDFPMIWRTVSRQMGAIISEVAKDRGIYVKPRRIHPDGWVRYQRMTKEETSLEKLKDSDPEAYARVLELRKLQKAIAEQIKAKIEDSGLVPVRKKYLGKVVWAAVTPQGEELVYDDDGDVLPVEAFLEKREGHLKSIKALSRTVKVDLEDMRSMDDAALEALEGEVVYTALTDDKAKQNALTRIYPVKEVGSRKMIVEGRFKGIYLDEMINVVGRQIEGVAYDFDPKTGIPRALESRASGQLEISTVKEPYVTVGDDGRLFLKLPSTHEFSALRKRMTELARINSGVEKVAGVRSSQFFFEPKDLASVREALGSMALSTSAAEAVDRYFRTIARHELATTEENLARFSAERLGGFKKGRDLYSVQKKALAWAAARQGSGVLALGTGVGKTSCGIAAFKSAMNDQEEMQEPFRGLYVCPTTLTGNLPSEAYQFMEDPKEFLENIDVLSYTQFTKAVKKDPNFMQRYTIVIFDEAQELSGGSSEAAKAASRPHPRKLFMTASPMERRPAEVYTLAALANNEDVTSKEFRRNRRLFEARFCEEIGGRFVSVKNDPVTQNDMRTWVRQNIFHTDKAQVEEYVLPDVVRGNTSIHMHPDVQIAYREVTSKIRLHMQGLVEKFRDQKSTVRSRDKIVTSARTKLGPEFKKLMLLANLPDKVIPGVPNPKIQQSIRIVEERIEKSDRVIFFTDLPEMAEENAKRLSMEYPGTLHACCLSSKIYLYRNGEIDQTFRKKAYKSSTRSYAADEWQMYVMHEYIKPNTFDVLTASLTASYAKGHNLQEFTTIVHLDRDSWNAEMMQQREARSWRQGQKTSVDCITLDVVYSETADDYDRTLDEIMRFSQEMEEQLFNDIIVASQTQALGEEYFTMEQETTTKYQAQRKIMEMSLSPYATNHARAVEDSNNGAMVEEEDFTDLNFPLFA
jgi:hypothetical protein